MRARATAIVPTVGGSAWLAPCLEALRRQAGDELEVVVVAQGEDGRRAAAAVAHLADRVLAAERNLGFAAANNLGLAAARGELVALVNDDAVVAAGWYRSLVTVLDAAPAVAAVQGINLTRDDPPRIDGAGIGWNRWWQAVQLGRGEAATAATAPPREVFGVSATAALYRREALAAVRDPAGGGPGEPVFDARLFAYYEDVDLAGRLRAAGWGARVVPAARAVHAGSASGRRLALGGWPLIYGNRWLVLARLLGRGFVAALPRIAARDALDLAAALGRADLGRALGIVAGWGRAARRLPRYLHRGRPAALERL